mmetsp:Transcript_26364/g.72494  ORF Transcript_26364/g.72494 Transcript_26364/m.72494 type:complete len:226 (-) Transcript_26364:225-902(-)
MWPRASAPSAAWPFSFMARQTQTRVTSPEGLHYTLPPPHGRLHCLMKSIFVTKSSERHHWRQRDNSTCHQRPARLFLTDDKWVVSACDEADDAALRVPDKTAPPLEEGIQKMKKKEKKRGGKKGKGKGKSKAAMAEPPSIPPDAIGLSVLLLEAGADPRIQDTTGQSQPRWVHEVWQALERPGVRSRGVDLDELRDFAWKAACAQVEELGDRKKGGKGKGKSKKK